MPEKKVKPPAAEEPPQAPEQQAEVQEQEPVQAGHSVWPWLIPLLLVLAAGALWFLSPQQTRDAFIDRLSGADKTITKPEPTAPAKPEPATPVEPVKPEPEPTPQPEPEPEPPQPTVTSEEVQHLLDTIADLSTKLQGLREEQQALKAEQAALRDALRARQRMDLRSRLKWITQTEISPAQLRIFWEDITLLPILSDEQRQQAEHMRQVATKLDRDMQAWSQKLQHHADKLLPPEAEAIPAQTNQNWLSWLTQYFHVSRAPSEQRRRLKALQTSLLQARQALKHGQWPVAERWNQMLEALHEVLGKKADLGLPENFESARHELDAMRKLAQGWLENM